MQVEQFELAQLPHLSDEDVEPESIKPPHILEVLFSLQSGQLGIDRSVIDLVIVKTLLQSWHL